MTALSAQLRSASETLAAEVECDEGVTSDLASLARHMAGWADLAETLEMAATASLERALQDALRRPAGGLDARIRRLFGRA